MGLLRKAVCAGLTVALLSGVSGGITPAAAESRTVRISCTILPLLEISSALPESAAPEGLPETAAEAPAGAPRAELGFSGRSDVTPHVRTNMGNNYRTVISLRQAPEGLMKVFTVTAL